MSELTKLLEIYEENISPEHIEKSLSFQKKYLNFEKVHTIPLSVSFPQNDFAMYPLTETHEDIEKMMFNELLRCYCAVMGRSCLLPMIRANYGVGTLASLFGLKSRIVNNNMPWVEHVGSTDEVREIVAKGVPDLNSGFGKKLTDTHHFYSKLLSQYPKCKKYIPVFHPDFQGPFDVAHLIWGPDIYTAIYDTPELVHELMNLVTETYIAIMKRTKTEINDTYEDYVFHWSCLYKGSVVLRNDSAVNVSAQTFKEFIKPYDEKILKEFKGGSMHYCGRADHLVFDMIEEEGLLAMNFGIVPNLVMGGDHLEFVCDLFLARKIPIINYGISREDHAALDKERFGTGISLHISAESKEEAETLFSL